MKKVNYKSIRHSIELYYDYQRARISYDHRAGDPNENEHLSTADKAFMAKLGDDAAALEKTILKYAAQQLKGHEIYEWLIEERGIAATFAVILLGMIDIEKATTVSALWRYCGLATGKDGKAERRRKGEKLGYNPHMKTRMYLLGESFVKARNERWRAHYDDYKARKQKQIGTCMLCEGRGTWDSDEDVEAARVAELEGKKRRKPKKCPRCEGTGQAPWGRSDKHVHIAAMRYMTKMFLAELYRRWREYEGLPVRPVYAEEYHERLRAGEAPRA